MTPSLERSPYVRLIGLGVACGLTIGACGAALLSYWFDRFTARG